MSERTVAEQPAPEPELEVGAPKRRAAGIPGVLASLKHANQQMGPVRSVATLRKVNQAHGFDCPGCAWPEPAERRLAEFCENGVKAVAEEATRRRVDAAFFAQHPISELRTWTEHELSQRGRLTEPVVKRPGADRYEPIGWDDAFTLVGDHLRSLDSPDRAIFYTSGRTSNEAAFAYQLFVRAFGTNNLPDCSNLCHESSGTALTETLGVGKGSVRLEDLQDADLILVVGQNPGTNHPRMLTALRHAKERGARIVAVNPLPEAGLLHFDDPQTVSGLVGKGTPLSDRYLQVRVNGDLALFQAVNAALLQAEADAPGTVLDHDFIRDRTTGFEAFADALRHLDRDDVDAATGLTRDEVAGLVADVLEADRIVVCWAMGLTQHRNSVATIREVVNFLLLRGNLGRPGTGVCPVRGHSNVQGDRTMGINEKPPAAFLDALRDEFGFEPPRDHGTDVVEAIRALRDGNAEVFVAMGGNFVSASPDTAATEAALSNAALTVQISTKLNRSHLMTGETAIILPVLGRTERDVQATGEQLVSVEDSMGAVHASRGTLDPASPHLRSEVAVVAGMARATLGDDTPALDWDGFEADYASIRDHVSRVVPGFENFDRRVRMPSGFLLPHPARDADRLPTATGRAAFTVNDLEVLRVPPGCLLLQTVRSHDQYNTTIYGLDDRYRGIRGGRRVVFVHPDDLTDLDLADGQHVDLVGEWSDGVERRAPSFRVVSYPTARGCAAAYFPETNVLVPLDSTAEGSNTPTSKSVIVRLEPTDERDRSPSRRAAR
ncbi:FdhF/YdeP family oxidoreductase [Nitriliruptor alkaliphilus]|uniref:FdhF/YdeP family oxidoreductase n=1 Tax=Nitriliruptor alkaliphilus TaxID=427918 RepID=UPI0006985C37|nr:FdhF/YdeP family oxidoreductase [Nitriliruptor alkaliphilus]